MQQQLTNNNNCLNLWCITHGDFCAGCGQPAGTGRISFGETIGNLFGIAIAPEDPFWLTIRC